MKVLSKHTHPLIPDLLTNCAARRAMTRTSEQTVTNRFSPGTAYSIYIMNKVNRHPDVSVTLQVELMVDWSSLLCCHVIFTEQPAAVIVSQSVWYSILVLEHCYLL